MSFSFRRDIITKPIFAWAHKALPPMSDTEREALEAGDVWWDADLFTGNPDWAKLLANAPATLTAEETAFLGGPVEQLCSMIDDWKVNWEWRDLPPEVWEFIKRNKFFGMIIPKEFGGLGFSPYAHSEVVRKISSRSVTAAVTVMVPNSLGPGELLMRFGTKEQQQKWLPGLADGREIPCFGLTSPEAGSDAAPLLTCAALNQGKHPAVISGIMKLHATERLRIVVDDAMDVHGGKAVIDGPQNYMGNLYRSVPVAITVEGANILTRNLIVFGQGATRAHPYLLEEINALGNADQTQGLADFDKYFWKHAGHAVVNVFRAWGRSWTGGMFAPAPEAGAATGYYRQLSRYSTAFALCADMALLTLGGALKRREMLSARFGDILSELYLLSAALKRWEDEGRQDADFGALEWVMADGIRTIENRLAEILANLPNRFIAVILKIIVQPLGANPLGPSDAVVQRCAQLILAPGAVRDRLTAGLYHTDDDGPLARLERAFLAVTANEPIDKKMRAAHLRDWSDAVKNGVITADEGAKLKAAHDAVSSVIEVDDFAPEALSPIYKKRTEQKQASPDRAAS